MISTVSFSNESTNREICFHLELCKLMKWNLRLLFLCFIYNYPANERSFRFIY